MNLEVNWMGWLNDLCETYDNCQSEVAVIREDMPTLLPIAHSTQNATYEITIDENGNFLRANVVDKADCVTIIPVNEDSLSRSGTAIFPHPLCDKLEYLAGDYCEYMKKAKPEKFEKYIQQLKHWVDSEYSCKQIEAIYRYLSKKTVMKDLIHCQVLQTDENGNLTSAKINGIAQEDGFVRFRVDIFDEKIPEVYKNTKVFDLYAKYYINKQNEMGLCYATGEIVACSEKHPAKIRNTADKAKLISANDTSGYTFRGRFTDRTQVANVGYETSQKAHNTLRWLVEKQGFRCDEQMIVAWENHDKSIPLPQQDTYDAFGGEDLEELFASMYEEQNQAIQAHTGEEYAKKLHQYTMAYSQELDQNSNVIVMGVEAATTGRLSITFYQKLHASDYLKRLEYWHKTCSWNQSFKAVEGEKSSERHYISYIGAPSTWDIVKAVCGNKASDKVKKSTLQRLLPCIVEGRDLPRDMVVSIVNRVSKPLSFDSDFEYKKTLEIACALIKKHRFDKKEEVWDMALDTTITERSYLFGRILATAQKLEEVALYHQGEKRDTTAERLHQQFKQKPKQTWDNIQTALRPYISRLKARGNTVYVEQLEEIHNLFDPKDFLSNAPLDESYLLGYYCQLYAYKKHQNDGTK